MNKGTIIYIGNFNTPEASAAGKRVYGNALVFAELGYRVILLAKSKDKLSESEMRKYGDKIEFHAIPDCGLIKTKKYVSFLSDFCKERSITPSAVVRYGSPGLAIFDYQLYRYLRKKDIPLIVDVVDWLEVDGGSVIFKLVKSIDTFLEKAIFNKMCDGIICISSWLKNYYRRSCKNVIVLPPLVEKYEGPAVANEAVQIVYAGSPFRKGVRIKDVHRIKDRLDLAVEAIARLSENHKDLRFNIYGITKEEYLIAFPGQSILLEKASENIVFHGMKQMCEVQEAVRLADFSILLREKKRSTMAGFPTKVVESLSVGTPVITTRTSDLEQYITDKENGFFIDLEQDIDSTSSQIDIIASFTKSERMEIKSCCAVRKDFLYLKYVSFVQSFLSDIIQ